MIDTVTITNDAADTFDPDTGTYADSADAIVYQGQALLTPISPVPVDLLEGGQQTHYIYYNLMIPLESAELPDWARVHIDEAIRDPLLAGRDFWVEDVVYDTFAVVRQARIVNVNKRLY
jgi:hypothetical protein